jgi:succinoglycan biosynthesis protein ExoA
MTLALSVIITSYNEGQNLERIFRDLSNQDFDKNLYEILFLEAGQDSKGVVLNALQGASKLLKYWHLPKYSRTAALNHLVKQSTGNLVVRLDARTHIDQSYLSKIYELSVREQAANVGGVQVPIGESKTQKIVAYIMSHKFGLGGGKSRNQDYKGKVDSIYLGAFNRKYMPQEPWFDEELPKISEDSDLNFRIRQMGGSVILDSSIIVWHYPRENLKSFFKLCFNYGSGRALFFLKHKKFSASRQVVLPVLFLIAVLLFVLALFSYMALFLLLIGLTSYTLVILITSFKAIQGKFRELVIMTFGFIGCHLSWTLGFYYGLVKGR